MRWAGFRRITGPDLQAWRRSERHGGTQMKHDEGGGFGMIWMMILCCLAMVAVLAFLGLGVWSLR